MTDTRSGGTPAAAPPEGPWRIEHPLITGDDGEQYRGAHFVVVTSVETNLGPSERRFGSIFSEAEAIAVRDALNRAAPTETKK